MAMYFATWGDRSSISLSIPGKLNNKHTALIRATVIAGYQAIDDTIRCGVKIYSTEFAILQGFR
jgi:hypothetical protein